MAHETTATATIYGADAASLWSNAQTTAEALAGATGEVMSVGLENVSKVGAGSTTWGGTVTVTVQTPD